MLKNHVSRRVKVKVKKMRTFSLSSVPFAPFGGKIEGCPIIVIHGIFYNKATFREFGCHLGNATNRQTYVIDLRNHNNSPSHEREVKIENMVADVQKFMKEKELKKVAFVCHTLTSAIAFLVACKDPESVEKIIMMDDVPFGNDTEDIRRDMTSQFEKQMSFLDFCNEHITLFDAKRKILASKVDGTKAEEIFLEKAANDLDKMFDPVKYKWKTDIEFLMKKFKDGAFFAKQPIYHPKPIEHPVLVVRCSNSIYVTDEKYQDNLKCMPNSQLQTMESTSHFFMFEETEKFFEIAKKFLKNKPSDE